MVIDASVWVSYYIAGQEHHEETVAWLDGVIRREGVVLLPSLAMPEIGGALSRRTGDAGLAMLALREIIDYPQLRIVHSDDRLMEEATRLAVGLPLRGADAVYVSLARSLGHPLITWDREQRLRAAEEVTVLCPTEA
ncbi:MAG: type II toxin-antitoxin system VapC family toxin [Chloroflexi bacterium]|nr:type II toxin-antitoxin system VapC family toxin [Chloroflexota bacterium]